MLKSVKANLILSLILLAGTPLTMADEKFDLTKRVWVDDRTVDVFVLMPAVAGGKGPNQPTDNHFDVTVYLVGELYEQDPYGPEVKRPGINPANGQPLKGTDGKPLAFITIPSHDDTFDRHIPEGLLADTYGYWVIAGNNANVANVKTRPRPVNSLASAPLAYAVYLDEQWLPLTNAATIKRGIEAGLLKAEFSNWGGLAWLSE